MSGTFVKTVRDFDACRVFGQRAESSRAAGTSCRSLT